MNNQKSNCQGLLDSCSDNPKCPNARKPFATIRDDGLLQLGWIAQVDGTHVIDIHDLGPVLVELGWIPPAQEEQQAMVESFGPGTDGNMHLIARHPVAFGMALMLGKLFKERGGENYCGFTLMHPELGELEMLIQRKDGKTPCELKTEADERVTQLEQELQRQARLAEIGKRCIERRALWQGFGAGGSSVMIALLDEMIDENQTEQSEGGL